MISREEMADLADFVLSLFNCKRDYSIDIVEDIDLEELLKQVKVINPSLKTKVPFKEEHGSEYVRKIQNGS